MGGWLGGDEFAACLAVEAAAVPAARPSPCLVSHLIHTLQPCRLSGVPPHSCACSWGVPTDFTGRFVGMSPDTFRDASGPVALFDPQLEHLQVGRGSTGHCLQGS